MLDSLPRRLEEDSANLVGDRVLKMSKTQNQSFREGMGSLQYHSTISSACFSM